MVFGMYGFMAKLIASGKMKFTEGKISLLGEPMAIVSMNAIKEMTDYAEKKGSDVISEFYFQGWIYGYTFTYNMAKAYNLKKFAERYKLAMDVAALCGFGDYKTLNFKKAHSSKFRVLGNPFALMYHPSDRRVCHFLRGMNGGGGTVVHERMVDCIELECAAQNGKYCLQTNVTEQAMKDNKIDPKLIKEQLDLKKLRPKQLALIKSMGHDPKVYTSKREIE